MLFANPALNDKTFENFGLSRRDFVGERTPAEEMTIHGTVAKTVLLLLLAFGAACFTWWTTFPAIRANPFAAFPWALGGWLTSFVIGSAICRKHAQAPVLAPLFALTEGICLGGVSAVVEFRHPGIVVQAIYGTFGTLLCMLLAYQSGLIKPTDGFTLFVSSATSGVCLVGVISTTTRLHGYTIPYINEAGPIGIGFCIFAVVVAAMNLVLAFVYIRREAERGAPKHLEWYAAFALMFILMWVYLQMLRLLSRLKGNS